MIVMRYTSLLGGGIGIYAIAYLVWSVFVTYGFVTGLAPHIFGFLILLATLAIITHSLRLVSWAEILPYSLTWALVMIALDAVLSVPVYGWSMYADWNVWVGYAIVALVPLIVPKVWRA